VAVVEDARPGVDTAADAARMEELLLERQTALTPENGS
jgi:hypothetical protein